MHNVMAACVIINSIAAAFRDRLSSRRFRHRSQIRQASDSGLCEALVDLSSIRRARDSAAKHPVQAYRLQIALRLARLGARTVFTSGFSAVSSARRVLSCCARGLPEKAFVQHRLPRAPSHPHRPAPRSRPGETLRVHGERGAISIAADALHARDDVAGAGLVLAPSHCADASATNGLAQPVGAKSGRRLDQPRPNHAPGAHAPDALARAFEAFCEGDIVKRARRISHGLREAMALRRGRSPSHAAPRLVIVTDGANGRRIIAFSF